MKNMLTDVLVALVLGIAAGVFTGLIPGIHVNLIAATMLSLSGLLLGLVDGTTLGVFIIAMSVVNVFLNAIPSIYLGAPDTENVLAVLPGHRMLLQGRGYEAVKLTVLGSFWALVMVTLAAPLLVVGMVALHEVLEPWIGWLLVGIVVWMIVRERNVLGAAFLFLLTGVLGLVVLHLPLKEPLFPLLSGLFGLSTLLTSLNDNVRVPPQSVQPMLFFKKRQLFATTGVASLVGTLVGFFPGVGPAQAAVVGSLLLRGGNKNFLVLVGGIGTANMVASLITFYALDKARNGAIVAVRQLLEAITVGQFGLFLLVSFVSGCVGLALTLFFARHFASWMQRMNYRWLCGSVITLIVVLVVAISGWLGLIVLVVSTVAGMIAPLIGVSRSQAMGCLLLPVILWFLL